MEIKVGKSYKVKKNRQTLFGSCKDIKALEGEVVTVIRKYDYSYNVIDKNGKDHVCESCNLEELNNNLEEI